MNETPTPRTDDALLRYTGGAYVTFPAGLRTTVDSDFARQLERELTVANQRITELEKDKARLDWLERDDSFPSVSSWSLSDSTRNYNVSLKEWGGFFEATDIRSAIPPPAKW